AALWPQAPDIVYLHNFESPQKPLALHLPAGTGAELRSAMERLVRRLGRAIPPLLQQSPGAATQGGQQALGALLNEQLVQLKQELGIHQSDLDDFNAYLALLRRDALEN